MQYLQQFHKIFTNIQTCCRREGLKDTQCRDVIVFLINHTDIHIIQYLTDKKHTPVIPGYSFPENNTNDK